MWLFVLSLSDSVYATLSIYKNKKVMHSDSFSFMHSGIVDAHTWKDDCINDNNRNKMNARPWESLQSFFWQHWLKIKCRLNETEWHIKQRIWTAAAAVRRKSIKASTEYSLDIHFSYTRCRGGRGKSAKYFSCRIMQEKKKITIKRHLKSPRHRFLTLQFEI